VYRWSESTAATEANTEVRGICRGSGLDLAAMEVVATVLTADEAYAGDGADDCERIFLVKEGRLRAEVGEQARTLGPCSVAMVMPGDACRMSAADGAPVTFFVLRYKSRHPVDGERGRTNGGSMLIEWTDLKYTATEVGGRRQPFERATAMFSEAEMHVTALNPGLTTHAPHTHVPEEVVLLIRGETEMSIDGKPQRGTAGDLYFLGSQVLHNIQ
jgi:(S)-ureidoglycine aminohydrolase